MHKIIIAGVAGLALSSGLAAQQFEDATDSAGVGTTPDFWVVTNLNMLSWMAASISAADFDGDSWDDMVAFSGDKTPMKLFHNDGDGTFTNVASDVGFFALGQFSQALCGDPDNDGDIDIMLFAYANMLTDVGTQGGGPGVVIPISSMIKLYNPAAPGIGPGDYTTKFFQNQGDGTFLEKADELGLGSAGRTGGAYGDLDGDLDLDLFTVSWSGDHQRVFMNTGRGGKFKDRTPLVVSGAKKRGFNAHIVDFDDDGDMDVLQTSDFGQSALWRNEGGWTFTIHDEGDLGIATDENGMGAAIGDYDNDGDFDWFVSSIYSDVSLGDPVGETGNRLYRNDNNGTWTDVTDEADVRDGGWGWGSVFADLDNDGNQDIVHTNGWMWDVFYDDLVRVYHNLGDGSFEDVASGSGLWDDGQGRGMVAFDYDHDGKIDIGVNNRDDGVGLWRNVTSGAGNWLEISLSGTTSNTYGIDAIIRVRKSTNDTSGVNVSPQHRLMEAPSHYQSQSPPKSWVGLGGLLLVDIKVEWPSGLVEGFNDVAVNQRITLVEGTGVPK